MNRPLRVMVTGAGGQVGVDLVDILRGGLPLGASTRYSPDARAVQEDEFEVLALTHHELDITDSDRVNTALRVTRPDVVIHLAAYTAVDRAETDAEACFAVNAAGTGHLSDAAHETGAHLIAVSTDYVFDGMKGASYVEEDVTNPLSVYGASKREGEVLCRSEDTIVRTSWVMGVRGKNVAHIIADRAASGETVRFVNDQTGTVTVASDLARALVSLARTRPGGIWHVANTGTTTWYDLADFVGRTLGRGDDFATAILTSDLSPAPLAHRPVRSDLDTTKWRAHFAAMPEWTDGVERLVRDRLLRVTT
ncbi:MAG: dTDP-4-dehydrorhamnose reductase [Actinomycetota bacterium]|nr:dTDP-4-dehydrorhamnose reductase [Actinomycetota bacterium]